MACGTALSGPRAWPLGCASRTWPGIPTGKLWYGWKAARIGVCSSAPGPVALFQGEDDRVVPKAQSDEIAASLRARGVPHVYHVYAGEGHGWRKSETIEDFYGRVEAFLKQYVLLA
jgi:dienelactone hydrolase